MEQSQPPVFTYDIPEKNNSKHPLFKKLAQNRVLIALIALISFCIIFGLIGGMAVFIAIYIHEMGHVFIMERVGIKDAQFFFVPFMGGVAVSQNNYTSDMQRLHVVLGGVMGSTIPLGILLMVDSIIHLSALNTLARMIVFINLINLVPLMPLDGGQALRIIGRALHPLVSLVLLFLSATVFCAYAIYYMNILAGLLACATAVMFTHGLIDEYVYKPLLVFIKEFLLLEKNTPTFKVKEAWVHWAKHADEESKQEFLDRWSKKKSNIIERDLLIQKKESQYSPFQYMYAHSKNIFMDIPKTQVMNRSQVYKAIILYFYCIVAYLVAGACLF